MIFIMVLAPFRTYARSPNRVSVCVRAHTGGCEFVNVEGERDSDLRTVVQNHRLL